jgi:hypothetical protein
MIFRWLDLCKIVVVDEVDVFEVVARHLAGRKRDARVVEACSDL